MVRIILKDLRFFFSQEPRMQLPDVRNTIKDEKHNVTYHVMAYRQLSRGEIVQSVRFYHAQPSMRRRKTPLKNKVITILTIHGASPGL